MRKPPRNALIALAGAVVGAVFVLSPAGAGIRHAFVTEHVDKQAVPVQARRSPIPPPPSDPNLAPEDQRAVRPPLNRSQLDIYKQRALREQRLFWGWTPARLAETKRIFAADPLAKAFFAQRKWTIETSGPWNARASRQVIGGALVIRTTRRVHGVYRLPQITSFQTGSFKAFNVGTDGARKFEVVVNFKRKRVVMIAPLELPLQRRDSG
jgi:hypothetical protein